MTTSVFSVSLQLKLLFPSTTAHTHYCILLGVHAHTHTHTQSFSSCSVSRAGGLLPAAWYLDSI